MQGSFAQPIANLKQEIEAISLPLQNAANAEQSLGQAAHIAGVDPASVPEYLEARKNAAKLNKQKNELQKKLDNLTLASAYEVFEDASVKPAPAEMLLKEMQPSERGFYPGLKEAAIRGEKGYKTSIGSLEYMGFVKAADNFYNDVLQGKIPADRAATYPVDKYIRENAEARIKVEQAAKANFETYKNDVLASLKQTADALPADKKFGNVGVVELTKDTPINDANREVAASTEALDICIGEGGSGTGTRNLFTGKKNPNRTAIVNLLTGEPNPNASRHTSSYVESLQRGEQLPMFRDIETGMPIAALQFHVASSMQSNGQPMFNIGYASGAGNGRIEAKYADGIRDYLNTRANDIAGIGNNLEDNTGIYDTTNRSSLSKARKSAQVSENEMKAVDWNTMPRFMTANDIKQAVKGVAPTTMPVVQQSPIMQESAAQLYSVLMDNIETVVDDAIQSSNLDAPEQLEERLNAVFSVMQQRHLPAFFDNPITAMNDALGFLRQQIDRRVNNASDLSQEMVEALDNYASELETARDDMISQQQRVQQQREVQQAHQMQPAEQLRQLFEPRLFAGNARVVNDALREYSGRLQNYAANQLQNGMSPVEIADNVRTKINEYRNTVLRGPTINTQDFVPDELSEYVSELRQMIDGIGQWLGEQQQPQTPNLPAEVQQNIDRRNQHITDAYQTALTPNTGIDFVDTALSEFSDMLDSMATNMFGNGYNASEIAENLADRIHTEHMSLVTPDRIDARGLTPDEADIIRQRLNNAYGNLNVIREMGMPAPEQGLEPLQELPVDFFEPDETQPANYEPYTVGNAISMAQDLFEQERTGANTFDVPSIEQSIYALREGLFDDERIRRLSPRDQVSFAEDVAFRLQNMLDDIRNRRSNRDLVADPSDAREALDNALANIENEYGDDVANDARMMRQSISEHLNPGDDLSEYVYQLRRNRPGMSEDLRQALDHMAEELESISNEAPRNALTPVPAQPATAPYVPIARLISSMTDQALTADMTDQARIDVQSQFELLTDTNSPEELRNIVSLARSYAMGPWENFSEVQREWLARNIEEYIGDNTIPNTPPEVDNVFGATGQALRVTDRDRELYAMLSDVIDNAIEEGAPLPDPTDGEAYAQLILDDEIGGEFTELTDTERRRLASIVRRYGADATLPPEGHKDGGRIRKYKKGGTVQPIPSVEQMKRELMMRRA